MISTASRSLKDANGCIKIIDLKTLCAKGVNVFANSIFKLDSHPLFRKRIQLKPFPLRLTMRTWLLLN